MTYVSTLRIHRSFSPRTRKLTDQQVTDIRGLAIEMAAQGVPDWRAALAYRYDVSVSTINGIVSARRKAHVER